MAKTIPADEKVFMVSKTTNTTYSGSAALKAMNEWYTMDDVTNTVRPYKVYTALLTQSGGDNPDGISSGLLTVGVTYRIISEAGQADFTNVGAPNNNFDTYFVSTGTTPDWGTGGGLEFNTGAPVATVLENTIGNVWFTYDGVGFYSINSNDLFTQNKTALIFGAVYYEPQVLDTTVGYGPSQINYSDYPNRIAIDSIQTQGDLRVDGVLNNTFIEIRVYS